MGQIVAHRPMHEPGKIVCLCGYMPRQVAQNRQQNKYDFGIGFVVEALTHANSPVVVCHKEQRRSCEIED